MTRAFVVAAVWILSATETVSPQSLTTGNGQVVLTVTQVERLTERRFYDGLGGHSADDVQIEKAGPGREFARLTFSARWLPGRPAQPCSVDGPPPLLDAARYVLIDAAGSRTAGLEASYVNAAANPCREFTVLFEASRAGAAYASVSFQGRKASLRQVAGANMRPSPQPD